MILQYRSARRNTRGRRVVSMELRCQCGEAYAVDFDDAHVVAVNPEEESGEGRCVDDAQAVRLAGLEGEGRILVEAHGRGH